PPALCDGRRLYPQTAGGPGGAGPDALANWRTRLQPRRIDRSTNPLRQRGEFANRPPPRGELASGPPLVPPLPPGWAMPRTTDSPGGRRKALTCPAPLRSIPPAPGAEWGQGAPYSLFSTPYCLGTHGLAEVAGPRSGLFRAGRPAVGRPVRPGLD